MVLSFSEAGRQLGLDRQTIADLVARWDIPVVTHPSNGRAKGIDEDGFRTLRERLGEPARCG